jgi:hypothetical protein
MNKKIIAAIAIGACVFCYALGAVDAQVRNSTVWQRYVNYGLLADRFGTVPGKLWMVHSSTAAPYLTFYDQINATWREIVAADVAETISGAWTFTGDTQLGDNEDDEVTVEGTLIRNVFRQDFDCDVYASLDAQTGACTFGDAAQCTVTFPCGDPEVSMAHFRLDGAQTSNVDVVAGVLDLDNDAADNEGVEIVFAPDTQVTDWICDFGEACYFRAGFTVASIDGTDDIKVGWKINGDFVDDLVIGTIDTYGAFYWNSTAGNCVLATGDDTVDATDEITGCDLSDAETIHVEVQIDAAGTFNFLYAATEAALESATAQTQVNTLTAAFTTGEVMVPFIALRQAAAADTELQILYVEVGTRQ